MTEALSEENTLYQDQTSKEELADNQIASSGPELADNQIIESPGSDPSSLSGRHFAMAPGWVDEKNSYTGRQSRIAEVYGCEVSKLSSELPVSHKRMLHEIDDSSALPTQPSTSVSLQRRSSPELLHPINSGPERNSLWERMRGMPAADRHRSGTSPRRSNWLTMDDTENATSLSSQGPSNPDGSRDTVPDHGHQVPTSNVSSDDPAIQDEQNDPTQLWTSVDPMSHTLSPNTTTDSPIANVVSPSSPITGLTSPPSDMLSPVSPIVKYVYPPSTIVSPATVTRDDTSPGTEEHLEEAGAGWIPLSSWRLQLMPKESDDTRSASSSLNPHPSSLQTVNDSMELSSSLAQQIEDGMPQQSLRSVHRQYQFEESEMPSVYSQPDQLRTYAFDSEGLIHSDYSEGPPEPEASLLMTQPMVTRVDTSRSDNQGSLPNVSTSASPPNSRMASSSQPNFGVLSPPEANRPATSFHFPSFPNPFSHQTSILTGPTMQEMEMGDADTWETNAKGNCETPSTMFGRVDSTMIGDGRVEPAWDAAMRESQLWKHQEDGKVREQEANIQEFERSDVGRSTSFPDMQLQSPLDNLIARIAFELNSTSPQAYPNDGCRHPAPQHHSRDCATSQALSAKSQPHCFNHNALLVSNSASAPKQVQVEELQELFRVINEEWMRRMEPLPQLWLPCSELSVSSLFERAIRTLKDFTEGRCALDFEDVFAMMHLAFAAAFSLHWQQDFYSWNAFCDDALQWQHALSDDEDKVLFLSAINRWWLHELWPTPLLASSCYTSFGNVTPQGLLYCGDQKTLPEILRNTEVFKVCIGFLDGKSIENQFKAYCDYSNLSIGFERAVVQERNDNHPAKDAKSRIREIQHMIKTITRPLLQRRGMEALRRIVIDTELLVDRGFLQNTREVEVTLLTSGRVSCQRPLFLLFAWLITSQWNSESPEVFESFYDLVTSQCDNAMLSSGPDRHSNWRNHYYIEALDRVLAISKGLDRQQSNESAVQHWPNISELARMSGEHPTSLDTPTSPFSTSKEAGTPDSSPTSVMSSTFEGSSHTAEASSHTISPSDISQTSISPTSPDFNTPTFSVVSCRACGKTFKGSPQDARSNYQRHLRESPRHNPNAGLKCPLPGCSNRKRMRSDNLGPHLKKAHKMSSKPDRQMIIAQSKFSAKGINSDGVARRRSGRG